MLTGEALLAVNEALSEVNLHDLCRQQRLLPLLTLPLKLKLAASFRLLYFLLGSYLDPGRHDFLAQRLGQQQFVWNLRREQERRGLALRGIV